jgi:hypothetical protein
MGRDVATLPLGLHSDLGRPPQRPSWLTYAPDAVLVAVAVVGAAPPATPAALPALDAS